MKGNPEDCVDTALWDGWDETPVEALSGDDELRLAIANERYRPSNWTLGLVVGMLVLGAIGFVLTNAGILAVQMIAGW